MAALGKMPAWAIAVAVVVLIAIGGFGSWLLSPLLLDETVVEEFPVGRGGDSAGRHDPRPRSK